MDNTDNIIPFDREGELERRIADIAGKLATHELGWIDGSVELAMVFVEGRGRYMSDSAFNGWLSAKGLAQSYNDHDRAALINMGRQPETMRAVLEETDRRSYQHIWVNYRDRFAHVSKPEPKPTSQPEPAAKATVAAPESKPAVTKSDVQTPIEPAKPVETYEVPKASKLRDMVGEAADVLHARFKHSRIFHAAFRNEVANTARLFGNYIAKRCQEPGYPSELLTAQSFSLEIVYPYLPKKLLSQLPNLGTLRNQHSMLAELERLFMATPEFGVVNPPLAAFNKAMSIYNSLKHRKAGGTIDPNAVHKPVYGDDEGKPPVVIRGTRLWPAENTAGYCYDDLRCACGFASDVMSTFDDTRNASLETRTLKLRHLMSWVDSGYNSTGSTTSGMLKAMRSVISAWTWNVSEEMRNPSPSMVKLDGDTR